MMSHSEQDNTWTNFLYISEQTKKQRGNEGIDPVLVVCESGH